jgi:serine/threonine-protein kinase
VVANLVTGTQPAAGTKLSGGSLVTLLVSSGPNPVGIPNVTNQTEQAAISALKAKGFVTKVVQATSLTVPAGSVISTDPSAGQSEAPGTTVTLTVSTGVPQVTVPDLAGDDPTTAGADLEQMGLIAQQKTMSSLTVADGLVIDTDPPAGTMVGANSTVTVYVSTGKPTATVPAGLEGEPVAQAESQLTAAGFKYSVTPTPVTAANQNNIVQSSSPSPGTPDQPTGTTVILTVGMYTAPTAVVPNVVGETLNQAESQISTAGFTPVPQEQTVSNPAQNGIVLSMNPQGSTTQTQGSNVTLVVGQYTGPTSTTSTTAGGTTSTTS